MKKIGLILITALGFNYSMADELSPAAQAACSPVVKGFADFGIGIIAETFTEELPFFGPFGSLITGTLSDALCPGEGGVGARLDQVDSEIAGLKDRMNAMDTRMNQIAVDLKNMGFDMNQALAAGLSTVYLNQYKANLKVFDDYYQAYMNLINSTGKYSSLRDNSQAYKGGFKALWNNSDLFKYAISSSGDVTNMLQAIMPIGGGEDKATNAAEIMKNLNVMCRDINSMSDSTDVVSTRIKCNLIIENITMQIAYRTLQAREMMLDYISTVLAAMSAKANGGAIDINNYPDLKIFAPTPGVKFVNMGLDLQHQPSALAAVKITNDYRNAIRNTFVGATNKNENMFKLYDGFDSVQLKSIASVCTDPATKTAGITSWYPNLVSGKPPYIITSCPTRVPSTNPVVGSSSIPMATGKVFYKDVTKWNNILGILVNANVEPDDSPEANSTQAAFFDSSPVSSSDGKTLTNADGKLLTNTKFSLTSNVPLAINSMTIAVFDNSSADVKQPDASFVQIGQFKPISLAYRYYSFTSDDYKFVNLSDYNFDGKINQTNQLLAPRVTSGTVSNTVFDADLYGVIWSFKNEFGLNQIAGLEFPGRYDIPHVYLSFKDDSNITHVFGLHYVYSIGGASLNTLSEGVLVRPQCLDINECKVTGPEGEMSSTITWTNGASITISQPNKNGPISLVANTKVNP